MKPRVLSVFFAVFLVDAAAPAQSPPAQGTPQQPPDESVLGTIDVNGSAQGPGRVPPPKLAVIPLITKSNDDTVVQLVTKRDIELSGEYEVVDDSVAPPGPWTRDRAIDYRPFQDKKVEAIVKVYAVPPAKAGDAEQLVGEVFVVPAKKDAPKPDAGADEPPPKFDPAATVKTALRDPKEARAASHRLVDQILGALTGRPGGFASRMTYAERVGKWRQVFTLDSDGFDLKAYGPSTGSALTPVFGATGEVFYAESKDFHRYKIVHGRDAIPVPWDVPGNILGISFSPDRKSLALSSFVDGNGTVYTSSPFGAALKAVSTAPNASDPAYGPLGKVAYVAGTYSKRVYINDKPVSPGGFMASSPAFCDTPDGLLVVFTVGYGAWSDVIAADTNGGGIRRITQNMGANAAPSCSPDGRMVAYFSSRGAPGKGPGLYIAPIARPWLAKKIASNVGEGLNWQSIEPAK